MLLSLFNEATITPICKPKKDTAEKKKKKKLQASITDEHRQQKSSKNLPTYCSLALLCIVRSIFNERILPENTKSYLVIYYLMFWCSVNTMETKDGLHYINFWLLLYD